MISLITPSLQAELRERRARQGGRPGAVVDEDAGRAGGRVASQAAQEPRAPQALQGQHQGPALQVSG